MKICFFNCTKTWGGGEKWYLDNALVLLNDGHEVVLVSYHHGVLLKKSISRKIRTKAFNIRNLSFLNPFKAIQVFFFFKKEQFDILVMNSSNDLKIAAPLAKMAGIQKIIYRRGSAIPIKDTVINRFLYDKCLTHILANSEETKRTILQNNPFLVSADKITVIYNGIRKKNEASKSKENAIPVIGNIGRLVYQKRQDMLIDIASILKRRGVKCIFRIGGDGVLMNELKEKIANCGLSDYISLTGFVKDPDKFLNEIDIFALTSEWEGFGYVLAEAMFAKIPLVAFDVSSNPELVSDKINGYLVPWENKQIFADRIQLLVENRSKRKELGESGYKIACDKFNFEKNSNILKEFLFKENSIA